MWNRGWSARSCESVKACQFHIFCLSLWCNRFILRKLLPDWGWHLDNHSPRPGPKVKQCPAREFCTAQRKSSVTKIKLDAKFNHNLKVLYDARQLPRDIYEQVRSCGDHHFIALPKKYKPVKPTHPLLESVVWKYSWRPDRNIYKWGNKLSYRGYPWRWWSFLITWQC